MQDPNQNVGSNCLTDYLADEEFLLKAMAHEQSKHSKQASSQYELEIRENEPLGSHMNKH